MEDSRVTAAVSLPREPKQERSRRKQEALLNAAEHLFARHGFDAVTADDIASHAGYGTGTFYNYFTNKTQVFLMVVARHETAVTPTLSPLSAAVANKGDLPEAIRATVRSILDDRLGVPWLRRIWLRLGLTDPEVEAVQSSLDRDWDSAVADVIQAGIDAGVFSDVRAAAMASTVRVLVDALADEVVLRHTLGPDEAVDAATTLIVGLMRT